jgi:short-subunit dehydrogenase
MQLEGMRAVITGSGSGIGRMLAIEGARRGVRVGLAGRRREALHATLSKLPGLDHFAYVADITASADRKSLSAVVHSQWGGLDILVNNAGIVPVGPFAEATDDQLRAVVETNLLAPMALTRVMLPLMGRSGPARIVNVGSMFGDIPYPLFAAYSATKAGLRGLSGALRRELAPMGVGVTYASPRATRTVAARPMKRLIEPFNIKFDTAENVARRIWDAVERDADSVYPAGPERFFVLLQRLAPRLVDRAVAKQLAKIETT